MMRFFVLCALSLVAEGSRVVAFGSLKSSVCGEKRERSKLYSLKYTEFLAHYNKKKKNLKEALDQLREAMATSSMKESYINNVFDRALGFQKCRALSETEIAKA